MLHLLLLMLYLPCIVALTSSNPENFEIKLNGLVVEEKIDTLNFIEGNSYRLECFCRIGSPVSVFWDIKGDIVSKGLPGRLNNSTLVILNISRNQSGTVSCNTHSIQNSGYRHFSIYIQYPPSKPEISGPSSVTRNSRFKLICEVDSKPTPTIWWTDKSSYDAPKLSEGPDIYMNVTEDEVDLYCVAYNTMFMNPADETCTGLQHKQTIFVWAHHHITLQEQPETTFPSTIKKFPTTTYKSGGQKNTMPSSLSVTSGESRVTYILGKDKTEVTPVPTWQVGLLATSMCGWVVAVISVITAATLCCWSRRNRRKYKINIERTPVRCAEPTRNVYTPSPSQPASVVPDAATAPPMNPQNPKDGPSFRYQGMEETNKRWGQHDILSSDAKWRDQRPCTMKPYYSKEPHYMNYPYSFVNEMVPYDDCIVPSQKTRLVIETTHV